MDDGSASARGAMDSAGWNRGASGGWRGEGDPRGGRVQAFRGRREGSRGEGGRVQRSRQAVERDGRSAGARPRLGPALPATPARGSSFACGAAGFRIRRQRCTAAGAAPALLRCGRRGAMLAPGNLEGAAGRQSHGTGGDQIDGMFPKRGGGRDR
ncbi:hypothetical protein PAHAL_5G067200 [Panicum hallii]|jgi:hypothetical protein|uniref:Uncharacterized protein n=1 Tax=Panicum hallii TaxID=206008 RepID=A0A2S3HPC8_9POAL|nr:hypothetical protein PAHAL_5G067200 [Panicum hallii]